MLEAIVALIFGLVIGSFLNVCIYRIPEGQSINLPRSHCRWCKHTLGPLDLVPVLSYICLGGKCRYCKKKVSMQYMLIELLNGVLYGITIYCFGLTLKGVLFCILISFMIVLTLIDMRYMLLPTKIIMTGIGMAFIVRGIGSYLDNTMDFLLQGVWGGVVGYGILASIFFAAIVLFKKEGMGYGDVRYLGMIGVFTSWQVALLSLFIGCLIGAIYGVIQLSIRKKSEPFPFGPFMSLGALVSIFYGRDIIEWYMRVCGF